MVSVYFADWWHKSLLLGFSMGVDPILDLIISDSNGSHVFISLIFVSPFMDDYDYDYS